MDTDNFERRLLQRTVRGGLVMITIGVLGLLGLLGSAVVLLSEPALLQAALTVLAETRLQLLGFVVIAVPIGMVALIRQGLQQIRTARAALAQLGA